MKKLHWMIWSVVMLLTATPLLAQGGCVNSPEAPTLVLAIAGGGAFLASAWRNRRL